MFMVKHPPAFNCGILFETDELWVAFTSDTNIDISKKSLDFRLLATLLASNITIGKHMNYVEARSLADRLAPRDFRCEHMSHMISWNLPHMARDRNHSNFPDFIGVHFHYFIKPDFSAVMKRSFAPIP
ncbi:MAG: hypothetical protein WCF90_03580 [Methanomicrobiales archaeon]